MKVIIRPWETADAKSLAAALSNPHVLCRLRDGLPDPYTEQDAADYINACVMPTRTPPLPMRLILTEARWEASALSGRATFMFAQRSSGII